MADTKVEKSELITRLVEVAHLYYDENFSQQEIADKLQVSRSLIAQYLQQARDHGIVRIDVIDPMNSSENIALEIQERANLNRVFVLPGMHKFPDLNMRAIASAAAKYIEQNIADSDILGMAWGRTITRIVQLLAPSTPKNIDVVPLMGERGYTGTYSQINQIVLQTAQSFSGRPYFLLTPMFVSSAHLKDELMNDPEVKPAVERWDQLTMGVIGIGSIPPSPGSIAYVGEKYMHMMQEKGAVGDICGRHFDDEGNLIESELNDRMISISLDQIRKIPTVVSVASGVEKTRAVLSAMKTRLFSVLFIDEILAKSMLNIMRKADK